MAVTVTKYDPARPLAKGKRMTEAGLKAYALAARDDANRLVPYETRALRGSSERAITVSGNKAKLKWGGTNGVGYAAIQYYAPSGWRYTTAGTGPKWFDKAKAANAAKWLKAAAIAMRGTK